LANICGAGNNLFEVNLFKEFHKKKLFWALGQRFGHNPLGKIIVWSVTLWFKNVAQLFVSLLVFAAKKLLCN
jgi:hypothetical protein